MTPGQALDWMIANPGQELVDDDGWKYQMLSGLSLHRSLDDDGCTVRYEILVGRTFRVPKRVIPKLPEGYHWHDCGGNAGLGIFPKGETMFEEMVFSALDTTTERALHAALVEEFDTRPK